MNEIIITQAMAAAAEIANTQYPSIQQVIQAAHRAGWEHAKRQVIEEWEKPYGLTDGSKFIDRLRNLEFYQKQEMKAHKDCDDLERQLAEAKLAVAEMAEALHAVVSCTVVLNHLPIEHQHDICNLLSSYRIKG